MLTLVEELAMIFVCLIGVSAFSIWFLRRNLEELNENKFYNQFLYSESVDEIFAELDFLINQEFVFIIQIPYEGKDVKKITNFEETLNEINNAVVNAININMVERLSARGISEEYIYSYITRKVMLLLMTYMKENNINRVSNKEEAEE